MVSGHPNNNNNHSSNLDAYASVMQGKVLFHGCQLPKLMWNQIKILIVSNKDGKNNKATILLFNLVRVLFFLM